MATATRSGKSQVVAENGAATDTRRVLAEYGYATATTMDIPIKKLVAEDFQRDMNGAALSEMVTGYDRNQFQLPTVCPLTNGTFSVIDGQHRVEMAKEVGISPVTCQVVNGLDYEQRAELFVALNRNRRWLVPAATFKAELAAAKPWAKEVSACLSARGLEIKSKHSPTGIASVMAVKKIYATGGTVRLGRVLDVVTASFPDDDPRRFSGAILLAINSFLSENQKADLARLENALRSVTGQRLIALGTQRWFAWQALDGRGGSKVEAISADIKKLYAKARA